MAELKERLRSALLIRGVKPIELSEKTGIPKSAISQYMSGYAKPKDDRIYLICRVLKIQEAWLLGYDVPMEKEIESLTFEDKIDETSLNRAINKASNSEELTLEEANEILKALPEIINNVNRRLSVYHEGLNKLYNDHYLLNAAHPDSESTEEDKKHDDEIMNDNNF